MNCVSNDVNSGSVACFASDGLRCAGDPANPTCTPLPAAGEACVSTCQGGLYCNEATLLCEPKLSEGAECRHHYECQDNFCSPAFGCWTVSVGDSMLCLRVIESISDAAALSLAALRTAG